MEPIFKRGASMYKHILIPTDGSALAARGIREGVRLAQALGAKVTGVHVAAPFQPPVYSEAGVRYSVSYSRGQYDKLVQKLANQHLAKVEREAAAAGVPCRTQAATGFQPWEEILRAARAQKCDAIVMASHGRGTLGGVLLGSETNRVLAHSKIPVLVVR
jgi:nucleotide-binding universal stress UspA family protein